MMNGDMIGRVIKGRYKLIDERGRGSFATVYIVRVVDYGNDNGLYEFIAMEYIDGQNLKYHMLTHGPMDPLRALNYTRQIAEGLEKAYKQGVVHRDIKPQNIL